LLFCLACMLSACATNSRRYDPFQTQYLAGDGSIQYASPPKLQRGSDRDLYEWHGDNLQGETRVVINLTTQRAEVFIGGQPAGWSFVATGREGYGTPAGSYRITEKVVDKYSNLFGSIVDASGNVVVSPADVRKHKPPPGGRFEGAPMPYWMRLTSSGIGLHAGPIPQPGAPASHGCIRLPHGMAVRLYNRVQIGTPVEIIR